MPLPCGDTMIYEREQIAAALHADTCHWCRMGSPVCDGQPRLGDMMRAAEFQAVLVVLARAA